MIIVIEIGDQIGYAEEGEKEFSFYNTVTDSFMTIGVNCVWTSRQDFIDDYNISSECNYPLERFLTLIPSGIK